MPILATNGDDSVVGTSAADQIYGMGGNDTVLGGLGNDLIYGDNSSLAGNDGELQVNETTAGQQTQVKLITLSNGTILATWHSGPTEANNGAWTYINGTYMARYLSSTGEPLGPEFAVSDGGEVVLGHEIRHAWQGGVTELSNGDVVFAWGENSSPQRVFARIFHPDGTSSGQFLLSDDIPSVRDVSPHIAANASGGFTLVCSAIGAPRGYDVWTRSFDSNGTPTSPSHIVNTYDIWDQGSAQITQLADGGHVIVWGSLRQGESDQPGGWYAADVYLQRYDAMGAAVGGETLVNAGYTFGTQVNASVTAMGDGGFVISWESQAADGDGYAVTVRRFDVNGVGLSEVQVNTTAAGDQTRSQITELGGGRYVVVWQSAGQDGDQTGVYYRVFEADNTGGLEMQANITTSGRQGFPDVTAMANGGFLIGWTAADGQDGEGGGIFTRAFDANGLPTGVPGNDSLVGGGGQDSIYGGDGSDTIVGGAGKDELHGDGDSDTIYGGSADDYILGGDGVDSLNGGAGNDYGHGGLGNDMLYGGAGNDYMNGNDGDDMTYGGKGNDTVFGAYGNDFVYGGDGDDLVTGTYGGTSTFGDKNLYGGAGDDAIYGETGIDNIYSGDGNDTGYGGGGNDDVQGGLGNDELYGGDGDDLVYGGAGNDAIRVNSGNATLFGNDGDDLAYGDVGNNVVYGGLGNDAVRGGSGEDLVYGGDGNDANYGDEGDDSVYGGAGNDYVCGDDDNYGYFGNDHVYGGLGADYIIGGAGRDLLYGGAADGASDVFDFDAITESANGAATRDIIYSFVSGIDKIRLAIIDANTTVIWDQAFIWADTTATANAAWYEVSGTSVLVRGDVDGDAAYDFEIQVEATSSLAAGDIIL